MVEPCRRCQRTGRLHVAHGLCETCYVMARRTKTLDQYRAPVAAAARIHVEDVEWLSYDHPESVAKRLGTTVTAIEKAMRVAGRPDLAHRFSQYAGRQRREAG